MSAVTPRIDDDPHATPRPAAKRSRDALNTQQLLLRAARRQFARNGYSTTTVRDIATEAGVNVALINRYFTSKEGLFEACLTQAAALLHRPDDAAVTVDWVLQNILSQIMDDPSGDRSLRLLLLLRTSGDERAEAIRVGTLQSFSESMAATIGWQPGCADGARLLLRAQLALASAMGIVLLRASTGLEPLVSGGEAELSGPLLELMSAMLQPSTDAR